MNILPGMTCLSVAEARDWCYTHLRSRRDVPQPRPAVWRNPRGYTYSVSAAGYEANRRNGYVLEQELPLSEESEQ